MLVAIYGFYKQNFKKTILNSDVLKTAHSMDTGIKGRYFNGTRTLTTLWQKTTKKDLCLYRLCKLQLGLGSEQAGSSLTLSLAAKLRIV